MSLTVANPPFFQTKLTSMEAQADSLLKEKIEKVKAERKQLQADIKRKQEEELKRHQECCDEIQRLENVQNGIPADNNNADIVSSIKISLAFMHNNFFYLYGLESSKIVACNG